MKIYIPTVSSTGID